MTVVLRSEADVLAMALVRDEAGGLECCQVMAERGLADVEVRGELALP